MGDNEDKRPIFGARVLEDVNDTFQHNVWDNVKWDSEQEREAQKRIEQQAEQKIPESEKSNLLRDTEFKWDQFYDVHQNRFFKDRHWLFTEFPELAGGEQKPETPMRVFPEIKPSNDSCTKTVMENIQNNCESTQSDSDLSRENDQIARKNYFEIGCGVGNTVFPILEYNNDPNLFVYCCDFSNTAINILKSHTNYNPKRCEAFVCDVASNEWKTPFSASSIDIITLIFVLSAIHPQRMQHVINQVHYYLKPGGLILFRDYGRYDMAQLRFKNGQMMEDNFYVRKDGTFVYFFTQDEVRNLFQQAGFKEELNYVDRRLQVNRSRQLKMYRVWIQAKYRKPMS